jgi:hypothetical protein
MVEMKFVHGPALYAPAAITLPDGKLHGRRDDSPSCRIKSWWRAEILVPFNGYEPKFEHRPKSVAFLPGIHQVEIPLYDQVPERIFS